MRILLKALAVVGLACIALAVVEVRHGLQVRSIEHGIEEGYAKPAARLYDALAERLTDCELSRRPDSISVVAMAIVAVEAGMRRPAETMAERVIYNIFSRLNVIIADVSVGPAQIKMSGIEKHGLYKLDILNYCDSLIATQYLISRWLAGSKGVLATHQEITEVAMRWIGEKGNSPWASRFSSGVYSNLVYHVVQHARFKSLRQAAVPKQGSRTTQVSSDVSAFRY